MEQKKELGKYPIYSISQVNQYLGCPKKYEYRYIKGISQLSNANLVFGNSIHAGLEHNFEQKIHTKRDLRKYEVVDVFAHNMEKNKNEPGVEWSGKFGDQVDTGKKLLEEYIDEFARPIQPLAVEQKVQVDIPGVSKPFVGYIDLLGRDMRIIDFKTASKSPSKLSVKNYLLQLSAYAYSVLKSRGNRELFSETQDRVIERKRAFSTRLDFLVKTKTPKIIIRPVERTRNDLRRFVNIIQSVVSGMESGVYHPNYSSSLCSPQYCPYWERCNKEMSEDSYINLIEGDK